MPAKTPENPKGAGRPKGSPNKLNTQVKTAIYEAFEKAGGVDYLYRVAMEDPRTFCALLSKVLPTEITGVDGDAIECRVTTVNIKPV